MSYKRGSLTIAGAGVSGIEQLTLGAVAAIENADVVCYLLADPATESFVRKKNPNTFDLFQFYDTGKPVMETYIQMSEVLLAKVREGQDVVGLFYGHPFTFADATQRAMTIAQREGYPARRLPGTSVEESVFAFIDVDPYLTGTVAYDATDIVENNRPLKDIMTTLLMIRGAGRVGNPRFNLDNPQFDKFVDILEQTYGGDESVLHHLPAQLPTDDLVLERIKISDLRKDEYKAKLGPASLLCIIPDASQARNPVTIAEEKKLERAAVSALANHQPGKSYAPLKENPALSEILERLALEPRSLEAFKRNPRDWINENNRALDDEARRALIEGRGIRALMRDHPSVEVAEERVIPY